MKPCIEYLEWMNAVLDGEASPAEQAELNAHLEQCPACLALFEDLRALRDGADTLLVSAPAGFTDRVMEAVRAESVQPKLTVLSTPKRRRKTWVPAAAMAAVCAIALIGSGTLDYFMPTAKNAGSAPAAAPVSMLADSAERSTTYGGATTEAAAAENCTEQKASSAAPQPAPPAATSIPSADEIPVGGSAAPKHSAMAPDDLSAALDLVVNRTFGNSGYTMKADRSETGDTCRVRLMDGETVIDDGTITYTGLSPNGKFYCFSWTWEGQSAEDAALFRYAVPLDLSYVMWAGETLDNGVSFLAALEN